MHLLHLMKKSKIYFLLLTVVLLTIPSLMDQIGEKTLGWQAFHPIILPVLAVG